jgi:hypothetical protein
MVKEQRVSTRTPPVVNALLLEMVPPFKVKVEPRTIATPPAALYQQPVKT